MITESGIKAALKRAALSGAATAEISDGGARGDGRLVLVMKTGDSSPSMQWYAAWWRGGRKRMAKIGSYPVVGIADARKAFRQQFAPEISAGKDPVGNRVRKARAGVTVKDLLAGYVAHLEEADRASAAHAKRVLLGARGASKSLGSSRRAADIRSADIRKYLAEIHQRGSIVMAAKARTYLHAAFAWAIKSANSYTSTMGLTDWGLEHNPVAAVPTDPAAYRTCDRYLTPAEVRVFWAWLDGHTAVSRVARVPQLILCTGQRVTEVLRIATQMIDRGEKMIDWSKTKNGLPHAIPISQRALDLLDELPANGQGMLFPHNSQAAEPARIETVEKVVRAFLKAHPTIPHFTPRDLRRTWKTLGGSAGLSKEIRDRLQNHARGDVSSRHYDRYDYLVEKRAAMASWDAYLDRILAGDLDNPVAEMKRAAEVAAV